MANVEEEEEGERPKRVNFRKELLRYQSFRNQELQGSEEDVYDNKGSSIWRNFVSQCSATFLAIFAVIPSRNLQTSIHAANELGKISLPAFWSIQDCLLLAYGLRYSAMAAIPPQSALRLFQTVTIITIHSAQILGNLLSSGLISASDFHCEDEWELEGGHRYHLHHGNGSRHSPAHHLSDKVFRKEKWTYTLPFIPIQTRRSSDPSPPVNFYQLLTLVYLCMSVVAMGAVLIFFETPDVTLQRRIPGWREKLRDVRKCLTDLRWLLVWFAAIYIGFAQGIIICDISKEYGSEVFGCFIVGYMMVSFGTGNLLAILLLERLRFCSTHPLFLATGFLMNIGVLILTSLWKPMEGQPSHLLLYTALWGIVDGTQQSQVQAVVGRYAREERETAMTTFRVSQGVGLVLSFVLSLVTRSLMSSLYVALPLHVVGFLGLILTTNEVTSRERTSQQLEASPPHSPSNSSDSKVNGGYCDISGEV
nr:hypothetical protein BaRGS_031666 [Batillaria attramentaria]